jgi:HK97 family phage portal protein
VGFLDLFGINRSKKEERSFTYGSTHTQGALYSIFNTEYTVTEEEAMRIPSVIFCVELISGSIAQLPIYLYKENDKGEVEKVPNDRRVFLLNNEPNSMLNGYNMKKKMVKDYLFYGTSYTKIDKVRNNILELYPLDMKNVYVTKYLKEGYKYDAEIKLTTYGHDGKGIEKIFKPYDLVTVLRDTEDGITSRGILEEGGKLLQLASNEVEYSNNILKNGALPIGVLQTANKISEQAMKRLKAGWETLYSGAKNAGKTVILEEGLEYNPISLKPNDLQMVESKKITISDISRLFNVPESMLNADANKYASNEQNNLYFLQYTLAPILIALESALDKSLLLENEKEDGYYFRFDTSEILRTTEKEKIEATTEALTKGLWSLNESRAKLDLPKLDDDYFIWSLGNVLFNPKTSEIIVPNMQGSGDLNDGPQPSPKLQDMKQPLNKAKTPTPKTNKGVSRK